MAAASLREAAGLAASFVGPVAVSLGLLSGRDAHDRTASLLAWLGDQNARKPGGEVSPASTLHCVAATVLFSALFFRLWGNLARTNARRAMKRHFRERAAARSAELAAAEKQFSIIGSDQKDLQLDDVSPLCEELFECARNGVNLPIEKRKEQLRAIKRLFLENEAPILEALRQDLGKPPFEATVYDWLVPVNEADSMLDQLEEYATPKRVQLDPVSFPSSGYFYPEPLGAVLVLGTWNFPVQLSMVPAIGAVAAGNCVLLKPSNVAPATAVLLEKLIKEYCDPRVLNCVGPAIQGDRHTTAKLLEHSWDHVFFTGSPSVGKVVYEGAAKHLTPVTLELGGKNPVFVDRSANVKLAAKRLVWARMINTGQQCIAPDTVLVHQDIREDFERYCKLYVESFYEGEKSKGNRRLGKIVGKGQFTRVKGMLEADHKGKLIVGGEHDEKELWIAPTVIALPGFGHAVMDEETFGPIMWTVGVRDMEEAIAYQQHRDKPLACYIFARDQNIIDNILYAVPAGGVVVNSCLWHAAHHQLPFGGVGNSGLGNYHGSKSFEIFSHFKPVLYKAALGTWDSLLTDPFLLYPPNWNNFTVAGVKAWFRAGYYFDRIRHATGL